MHRSTLDELSGRHALLVASTGGHLTQLARLAPGLGLHPDSPWLTFDNPQSRSLLAGKRVIHVPYVAPRDYAGIMRAARIAQPVLRDVDAAVSTGAGLALAVLPQVALTTNKPAIFLESISRVVGPSLSGRILSHVPRVGMYAQHGSWLKPPWRQGPSVLAGYEVLPTEPQPVRSILVTLGTIRPYRFDRLVDAVKGYASQHPEVEVLWQLGATTRDDLPGRVVEQLGDSEFALAIAECDVVVAHSGVGVAMNILDTGRVPLLLARRQDFGEHVDDHQQQILDYLGVRGLALDAASALHDPAIFQYAVTHKVHRLPAQAPPY